MKEMLFNSKVKLRILRNNLLKNYNYQKWLKNGKPIPPPHLVKQKLITEYVNKYHPNIFIETGTYLGDMVFAQKNSFESVISIEIQPQLKKAAEQRFKKDKNVTILLGDSGKVLHEIMPKMSETALLWLDGHYSGGITGKSDLNCPIFNELNAILKNNKNNHIILIDDANCFDGKSDYPTYEVLSNFVKEYNYQTNIIDNVIVAVKK